MRIIQVTGIESMRNEVGASSTDIQYVYVQANNNLLNSIQFFLQCNIIMIIINLKNTLQLENILQ